MAFDCIRASCRTVSSSFFIAGMEDKTDYVIVPLIYSQNLTCCQHIKNLTIVMASECLSCSRFLALVLLHCSLQSRQGWFKCGMTVGSTGPPDSWLCLLCLAVQPPARSSQQRNDACVRLRDSRQCHTR